MSTHKYIDRLCAAAMALCLLLTAAFMSGGSLGIQAAAPVMGYEARLFDTERVHTIDIVMDDWDGFLETCENEEYAQCAVVIDGEAYKNTGIRAKGNTSLTMVSAMDSSRYSFKLEFDHYDSGRTYYGLDKLSLNNLIQDTTYMKDFLTYRMMGNFGVAAPLCSYVFITVNGQDWGLYLAVEGVEDAFLRRNYGNDPGELYKPDSMSFGGGRGNGREFRMEDFMGGDETEGAPFGGGEPADFDFSGQFGNGSFPVPPGGQGGSPGGFGSDDVKLKYLDDDPDSYSNIFQNAKTDLTEADQDRLIAALKALGEGGDLENTVDVDQVIRYFVVHNFVCNGDSYTGSMVHNYYLHEKDGKLSMIPWDYNLAYGTFQSGDASGAVNAPIDTPVSRGDSRPMLDWIFDSEGYTALYHRYFQEFLETAGMDGLIARTAELIAPYVEKDPTAFYSYEEFTAGTEALKTFCRLRTASVSGQLDGSIPSTEEGQALDASGLIDTSSLSLSDMGTMNQGGGFGGGGPQMPEGLPDLGRDVPEAFGDLPLSAGQSRETSETEPGAAPRREHAGRPEGGGPPQGENGDGTLPASGGNEWILTGISCCILLAGILFALLYRRR